VWIVGALLSWASSIANLWLPLLVSLGALGAALVVGGLLRVLIGGVRRREQPESSARTSQAREPRVQEPRDEEPRTQPTRVASAAAAGATGRSRVARACRLRSRAYRSRASRSRGLSPRASRRCRFAHPRG